LREVEPGRFAACHFPGELRLAAVASDNHAASDRPSPVVAGTP
jgi:hypothetical protein